MSTFYLDYVNGNDANDGSTWVLAWKTITNGATAARIAPGDIIRIAKSPDPTSLGMTATWTNLSRAVTLNSALTANVDLCETAWTASANVTCTTSTTRKEGSFSASSAIAALFATGKVAYIALAGATDYSGYQQLSFWIRTSVAIAANTLKISLCSDTIGDTPVDDFLIPAVPNTDRWTVFTINKGAALGNSIQSVALYALLDPGTPTILLDNILACKAIGLADSLSLSSLISKNSLAQGGTEGWFGIKSINGTAIELDNETNTAPYEGRGYSGTTETVTTYKRETIKTDMTTSQTIQDSGTLGNNIEYQGGWDTATNIQDGETYFDGSSGSIYGLDISNKQYNTLNYLNFSRYRYGFSFSNSNNNIITISNANNNYWNYFSNSCNNIITILNVNNNGHSGIYFGGGNYNNNIGTISNANNNIGIGFTLGGDNNTIGTISNVNNNGNYGITFSSGNNNTIGTISNANNNGNWGIHFYLSSNNNTIRSLYTSGNGNAGIFNGSGINYLNKAVITEAIEVESYQYFANYRIFSQNHDNIADNHWIFTDWGTINSQTAVRHTTSGIAWLFNPSSINRSVTYPLDLNIAKIAVSANNLVTVKGWFRRDNIGLTMSLVCKGGQINGVPSDVVTSMTAIADTWEELTITFTPTEVGVVEILAYAYGGTNYSGYVDDMTITQA